MTATSDNANDKGPPCVHCGKSEEKHLAYSFREGKRGCVGESHATTGFTPRQSA